LFDRARRHCNYGGAGRYVSGDNRARADRCSGANPDTASIVADDYAVRSEANVIFHYNP